ncbi:MAG: radical SAM protein [Desulfomonilaceae bacterium]
MRLSLKNLAHDIRFNVRDSLAYFIFYVTQGCNMECAHCFNHLRNHESNKDLTVEEIDLFSRNLGRIKYMTMAGGEPMLRPRLGTIAEIFYRNNKLDILNVSTNGWLTDRVISFVESTLNSCPGLTLAIAVSVDGGRETHDSIRRRKGSFDRAVNTLKELKRVQERVDPNRLAIFAHGTYNALNAHEFLDTARFFSEKIQVPYSVALIRGDGLPDDSLSNVDIDHFYSVALIRGDGLPDDSLSNVDIDHFYSVFKHIIPLVRKGLAKNYPFRRAGVAMADLVGDVIYNSVKHSKMTVPCKAGKKCFVITADGDVILCELLNIVLGNIRDHNYDPMKLLSSDLAVNEIRAIKENECHCTWECFQLVNVWSSPRMAPRIIGKAVSYAIQDWRGGQ